MKLYEAIILSGFDIMSCIIVANRLLNKKVKISKLLASVFIFSIIIGTESHYIKGWYSILLSGFLIVVMFYIIYRQTLKEIIFLYLISTILILSIQFLSLLPLKAIFGEIVYTFKVGVVAQTISLILTLVIVRLIPLQYIYKFVTAKNKIFKVLIINLSILVIFMLIYWSVNIDGILENLISVITLSLFVISINFVFLKNSLKNEQAINKLKANEQYLPIIDELITDIKTRQHDYKNHIQALSMMIYASEDKKELVAGFEKYMGEIAFKDNLNEFLKHTNKVIAGFLYGKKNKAETMGIAFSITIGASSFESKLYDYEWVEMLGILIDNAIESKVSDNEITVIIDKEKDMNSLIVKNKHPYLERETIKKMFNKGVSMKSNSNWGYGLYNLEKIVSRNQGTIEVYNESDVENRVVFKLLVP